jgi:DNA adenine methylase
MNFLTTEIRPVRPAAPYQGGKRNLAKRICAKIREIDHRTYVEPFVGMGGIFLRRDRQPPAEVINDISGDVANLFRIMQRHYQPFVDLLKWRITSRAEFDRLNRQDPSTLTDLERAARFLYLQRLAFGGKVVGRGFGIDRRQPARFDLTKLEPMLADIHERLSGVVIEQLPYGEVLRRYDAAETLFYLDPPYWGCEDDYGDGFSAADHAVMAEQLGQLQGQFLLSINDTPGVRDVYGRFLFEEAETTWSIGNKPKKVGELIISNR